MDKLFTLLELQRQAIEASSRAGLLHIIVNETRKLIPYTQSVFWSDTVLSIDLEKISGNTVLDAESSYATSLKSLIRQELKAQSSVTTLSPDIHKTYGALLIFRTIEEGLLGGLWIEHEKPFTDAEIRILEEISATYAHALAAWKLRKQESFLHLLPTGKKLRWAAGAALLLIALSPVRLSITGPAEIVAKKADIVTAPYDGMIEYIAVEPGDAVKEGDILVSLEHQSLQAQMDMAQQEMLSVQAALSRLQRESLSAPDKKTSLTEMQEEIEGKKIAYDYARKLKDRSVIKATRDGIAVFSESNALRGKPVRTGDKIMMVADPSAYEVLIRIPADAMVPVKPDSPVKFFLNVSPLNGHDASIRSIGYQSSPDADGLLTYKIMATPVEDKSSLRIGWKGTARIQGDWTILSYAVLRRPVIAARNMLGL